MIRLFRYIVYNSWIVVITILSLFYNDRIISYIVAICNYVILQALYPVVLIVSYKFRLYLHLQHYLFRCATLVLGLFFGLGTH